MTSFGGLCVLLLALACCAFAGDEAPEEAGATEAGAGAGAGAGTEPGAEAIPEKELHELGERRMSDQMRAVLRHFQQEDPVGLPGVPVPDPMAIPEMKHSFSVAKMTFKDVRVFGLSKFRLERVHADLAATKMAVAVSISRLDIRGLYTMKYLWSSSNGNFHVNLTNVYVQGEARLVVRRNGSLEADDVTADITFSDIDMEFQNLGFMANILQGIINSVGTFLFDSIKPFILKEVNQNIRGDINKELQKYPQTFPNSISPLDKAIADVREQIRKRGLDPYYIPNYNYTTGLVNIYLTHIWLTGIGTIYREGNTSVSIQNNIMYAAGHVATQRLNGSCHWEVNVAGLLSRAGTASFWVEHIKVKGNISQPLDTRKRAKLEDLELDIGNIQSRMDGAGTIDYVVEFSVNILPNILRYPIINAIGIPLLKDKIQKVLNKTDVNEIIDDRLSQLEEVLDTLKDTDNVPLPVEEPPEEEA